MIARTVIVLLLPMAISMQIHDTPQLTLAAINSPQLTLANVRNDIQAISAMEQVFARSDEVHHKSMTDISQNLTFPKAVEALQQSSLSGLASLKQIESFMASTGNLRTQGVNAHDGFGGLDGARRLLNDMIVESATKYDAEIAKCTDYYSKQCAIMEVARGQISAANYISATARGLILDAQANINTCEVDIPKTKQELKDHNLQCKTQLHGLNKHLKLVMADIAILTMILEMSDCDAKLIQMDKLSMLRCEDQCSMKKYITFNHDELQERVNQLQSPASQDRVAQAFRDLFDEADADSDDTTELVQVAQSPELMNKTKKVYPKTKFNNPPTPKTKVPGNPCTDKNGGAPSAANKRAAKCTLKKSPRCYKLQGRFLVIQAGIIDDRDALMSQIAAAEASCKETKLTLESSIENDGSMLASSQTKLAAGTEKEASAGETGRQVSKENDAYHQDLLKTMKTCTTNYINFETEICALKKIRGDVFKKMQKGHSGFFQDCELSKWTAEACSKKCAGGEQKLIRSVMSHPAGGAKCLPTVAKKRCNLGPCPIDCRLATWSGWSKCSSKCGGGISNRVRDVKVAMRYEGKPCGPTSQTKVCNMDSCETDCVLRSWTRWTSCSKHCDGGSRKRVKSIREPAVGAGKCAGQWEPSRLQYKTCNMRRCKVPNPEEAMKCNQKLDVILLLDGTPKSGKAGFADEIKAANLFVDAFTGRGVSAKPNFAVIHYSGPRTWSGVSKCTGERGKGKVDVEKTCHIKIAQQFTEDVPAVKNTINGLQYTPGSKLLSLALMSTQSVLMLSRATARSIVVVFIDGAPLSFRKTGLTSRTIRKKARLLWVPVTKFSPLKDLKSWASRRWQENLVPVKTSSEWAEPTTITHVIANICPRRFPKLRPRRLRKQRRFR